MRCAHERWGIPDPLEDRVHEEDVNPLCGCHILARCDGCMTCTTCDGCYCGEDSP